MRKIVISWIITGLAVAAAAYLVPGIEVVDARGFTTVMVMAAVLGLINATVRPVLALLSCGCIIATLGLFMLVINTITFLMASWITANWFDLGFQVNSWFDAFLGSLVVSVVSFVLSMILYRDED